MPYSLLWMVVSEMYTGSPDTESEAKGLPASRPVNLLLLALTLELASVGEDTSRAASLEKGRRKSPLSSSHLYSESRPAISIMPLFV